MKIRSTCLLLLTTNIEYDTSMKKFNEKTKEEALSLINKYLNEQMELAERQSLDRETYNLASWSEFQADLIGTKRILRKVIRYINE